MTQLAERLTKITPAAGGSPLVRIYLWEGELEPAWQEVWCSAVPMHCGMNWRTIRW